MRFNVCEAIEREVFYCHVILRKAFLELQETDRLNNMSRKAFSKWCV